MQAMDHYVPSEIRLTSPFGGRLPPMIVAHALHAIVPASRSATYMAIEGRGKLPGRPPNWARDVSDIRFSGAAPSHGEMVLRFVAPRLGLAVPHLYQQSDFWRNPPPQDATPIDLLVNAINEISAENRDSDAFDQAVLRDIERFGKVLEGNATVGFNQSGLEGKGTKISGATIEHVRSLSRATPLPHIVRIVGTLDMIRASTQAFALKLDDGSEVSGVYEGGPISELQSLFQCRVLVNGELVYKASGRPLRIDAKRVALADGESSLWTRLPAPPRREVSVRQLRQPQTAKTGLSAIIGHWPGDESDEDVSTRLTILS